MDCHDIRLLEEFVLRHQGGARRRGDLRRQVLAPGDDLHAECQTNARHVPADTAETQHAQHPAIDFLADRGLPATGTN
jgi:hypothetical protein